MKISEVEKITGLTAKAIRLYEEKGLVQVERKNNSYRDYDEPSIKRLKYIRTLRNMGISLSQICLHLNGVITEEELLNSRKAEMEKERVFQQESYDKCLDLIRKLQICDKDSFDNLKVASRAEVLLGLDIGTTNISAVILDYKNKEVLETYVVANTVAKSEDEDLSEFDTEVIYDKAKRIIDYLITAYPNTKSIGITGQMHGVLYTDKNGDSVSPFYNWQDGRGNRIYKNGKTYCEEICQRTGYVCNSGYAFATMFYNNENGIAPNEAYSFCGIIDYIYMKIVGIDIPVIHPTNAASFGLYDINKNQFDAEAVKKIGLGRLILPKIFKESGEYVCYKNIPVSAAIGDNQASFFGSVKEENKTALVNFGTGSQVSVVTDKADSLDGTESITGDLIEVRPYLFDKYLLCGSALCGGKAYAIAEKFFADYAHIVTGREETQFDTMNKLAKEAYINKKYLDVSTLFCGTRRDPKQKGGIYGIDDVNFTPRNLILGIICGMVKELYGYFEEMKHNGITKLAASGNAVKKNEVLQRVLKDIFKKEVSLTGSDEEAAIGCALYSGVMNNILTIDRAKEIIQENKAGDAKWII